ncbi:tetratricopeptide repeat protein, partial [Candidatus Dependentiae bacterium]|nr:tetratricopeptide repeat protein [Candidatus Dependentiae bacterium]
MDDMQEKINEYLNELQHDPSSTIFAKLADAYRKNGDYDPALKVVEEGIQKNPEFIKGWIVWGKILADSGRNDDAIDKFKKVTELNSDNLSAYLFLGRLYKKVNNLESALDSFNKSFKLSPDDEDILEEIENLKTKISEQGSPSSPEPSTDEKIGEEFITPSMAEVLVEKGEYEKALEIYQKILATNPNDQNITNKIVELETKLKSSEEPPQVSSEQKPEADFDDIFAEELAGESVTGDTTGSELEDLFEDSPEKKSEEPLFSSTEELFSMEPETKEEVPLPTGEDIFTSATDEKPEDNQPPSGDDIFGTSDQPLTVPEPEPEGKTSSDELFDELKAEDQSVSETSEVDDALDDIFSEPTSDEKPKEDIFTEEIQTEKPVATDDAIVDEDFEDLFGDTSTDAKEEVALEITEDSKQTPEEDVKEGSFEDIFSESSKSEETFVEEESTLENKSTEEQFEDIFGEKLDQEEAVTPEKDISGAPTEEPIKEESTSEEDIFGTVSEEPAKEESPTAEEDIFGA